jgi:hypothetical protein
MERTLHQDEKFDEAFFQRLDAKPPARRQEYVQTFTSARNFAKERPALARQTLQMLRDPSGPGTLSEAEELARSCRGLALTLVHLLGPDAPADTPDLLTTVMAALHLGAKEAEANTDAGPEAGGGGTNR